MWHTKNRRFVCKRPNVIRSNGEWKITRKKNKHCIFVLHFIWNREKEREEWIPYEPNESKRSLESHFNVLAHIKVHACISLSWATEHRIKHWKFSLFGFPIHFEANEKKKRRRRRQKYTIFYQMSHAHCHSKCIKNEPANEWHIQSVLCDSKWNMNLIYFDIRPCVCFYYMRIFANMYGNEHTIKRLGLTRFLENNYKSIAKLLLVQCISSTIYI